MKLNSLLRALLAAGLGIGGLILFWSILPATGQAALVPPQASKPVAFSNEANQGNSIVEPPVPDPYWLALVKKHSLTPSNAMRADSTTLNLNMTEGYAAGRVPTGAPVSLRLLRGGNELAHTLANPVPDPDGFFYLAYLSQYYFDRIPMQPGDVVWMAQHSTTLSMTVPVLSGLAEPATDLVYGESPANAPITLYLYPFAASSSSYTQTAVADAQGKFQASFSGVADLRSRDHGYALYTQDTSHQAYSGFVAPFLRTQVGGSTFSGYAAPWSSGQITVTNSTGANLMEEIISTTYDGSFANDVYYPKSLSNIQPGYHILAIVAGQTFSMTVGSLTAHTDLAGNRVDGQASSGQAVEILRFNGPLSGIYESLWSRTPASQVTVTASPSGAYSATLPLAFADYGAALITSPEGNQTYARFAVPYLRVPLDQSLNYGNVYGQVDDVATPITIEVQGASGYLKDIFNSYAGDDGTFYLDYYPSPPEGGSQTNVRLQSGDVLTLTTRLGVQIDLTLPVLTAKADAATDTVSGHTIPYGKLLVRVNNSDTYPPIKPTPPIPGSTPLPAAVDGGNPPYEETLEVTADALGNYLADFSSLGGFSSYSYGDVTLTTQEGYAIVRYFSPNLDCPPGLLFAQVGGNHLSVGGTNNSSCSSARLRLADPQGRLKTDISLSDKGGYIDLTDSDHHPIPILSGDTIEIYANGVKIDSLVPDLSADLDIQDNRITGSAPAGKKLVVTLSHDYAPQQVFTATASAQGFYSINLPTPASLMAGDQAQVKLDQDYAPHFYFIGGLPTIRASLYQLRGVTGWLPPLSPYTLTVPTSPTQTLQEHGFASTFGLFNSYNARPSPGTQIQAVTPSLVQQMTVPSLTAPIDQANATISGEGLPNSRLFVSMDPLKLNSQWTTADAQGFYHVSFPNLAPLKTVIGSVVDFDTSGNQAILAFGTPSMDVTLGSNCMRGFTVPGAGSTVTLLSADGSFSQTIKILSYYYTFEFYVCFNRAIEPGDHLTLVSPSETDTLLVPNLTAVHDYALNVLQGLAPTGSLVEGTFLDPYFGISSRHTYADTNGHYGLDTSDLYLPFHTPGSVLVRDSAGNTIHRNFFILGIRFFLPAFWR